MAASWQIVNLHQVPSVETGRVGQMDTWIVYRLTTGEGASAVSREFTVRMKEASPSEAAVKGAVQQDARLKALVLGASGTL